MTYLTAEYCAESREGLADTFLVGLVWDTFDKDACLGVDRFAVKRLVG